MWVRCAWSVASLLHDTSLSLLSLCAALSSMRFIIYDMLYEILKVQQLVARFTGDVHTAQVHKNVMTLAGLEPAIFGSEDQRLIH